MSEPFLAQVTMFAGNFAPRGWSFCSGQLLPISQYSALFSLLGTIYGGDGRTTFALPDLRGRGPIGSSNGSSGPGLSPRPLGQRVGAQDVTLSVGQIPAHHHSVAPPCKIAAGDETNPSGAVLAIGTGAAGDIYSADPPDGSMTAADSANTGGSQPHNNMQPSLAINFIIAIQGTFPSRS